MKNYSFRQCTLGLLEKLFDVEQVDTLTSLTDWMNMSASITDFERQLIDYYQDTMRFNLQSWNEQELALNFIGPFMGILKFKSKKYNLFSERPLDETLKSVTGEDIFLNGKPDGFIASGFRDPEKPFFSFHEHKPEVESSGDPVAQVLAAMLVGQAKNADTQTPMYGCYIIGQNWYFLVLEQKQYAIATPLAATGNEILDIFRIMKALKAIIDTKLNN
jgi:hypothetical protein